MIIFTILETSLIMSVAILSLLLFTKIFGKKTSPGKRHLCWMIIVLGLLVPYRPSLPSIPLPMPANQAESAINFSVVTDRWDNIRSGEVRTPAIAIPIPVILLEPQEIYAAAVPADSVAISVIPQAVYIETNLAITSPRVIPVQWLLMGVWVLGAVSFSLIWAIRHILFARKLNLHSTNITSGNVYNLHILICCYLGLKRRVKLKTCPIISVPVMYGLFRPVIVLPEENLHQDRDQMQLTLLHEALHIKNGDLITRILCLAALAVHWFNPLVYLMNRAALDESEKACDDAVIFYSGNENREIYGKTLLLAAKQEATYRKAACVGALAYSLTGGGKKMKRRLSNILFNVKPKRWVLIICTILMITGVLTFSLVSCGSSDTDYNENYTETTPTPTPGPPPPVLEELEGETLTIAITFGSSYRDYVNRFRAQNPHINLEVIDFDGDWERSHEQLATMLMAGTAPVLMCSIAVDHMDSRTQRLLTDWFPIMRADPYFDEDDFFMNAFHAASIDGRLYNFPLRFSLQPVLANSTVVELSDLFAGRSSITMAELVELHQQASTDLYFDVNFDTMIGLNFFIDRFFCFESRRIDFNNQEFIDFITYAREITNPTKNFGWVMSHSYPTRMVDAEWGQTYFFNFDYSSSLQYRIEFEEPFLFANPLNVVNDQNELLISPWSSFSLNAQATEAEQALAWHFISFMMDVENLVPRPDWGRHVSLFPINRESMRFAVERQMRQTANPEVGLGRLARPYYEQSEEIIAHFEALFEMPMVSMAFAPSTIVMIILEVLEQFHDELITAEQAALYLQNRVTLAMMEMD